jgi:hypothetical protein
MIKMMASQKVVTPAEAGVHWLSGCQIKLSMTALFRED